MECKKISYRDFRCIESADLEFSPGINIFTGANAQGKTTALEGIFLFARGKSFRTRHDEEMIRFGCETASVEMVCTSGGRVHEMRMAYTADGRRLCRRNDVEIRRLSEFVGTFRAVLFCPAHLGLVSGGPLMRRSFLDQAISQVDPGYLATLQRYLAILQQRNALIKDSLRDRGAFDATVDHWSDGLAREGEKISQVRQKYVAALSRHADAYLSDMTGGDDRVELTLGEGHTYDGLYRELTRNLERERRAGATLYGPHKDDVEITLSGRPARIFSSQGQQRSIALAMKLAEGELSRELTGEEPVLAFDDVLSELDRARRAYVINGFTGRQIFLTTCGDVPSKLPADAARFGVSAGTVTRRLPRQTAKKTSAPRPPKGEK